MEKMEFSLERQVVPVTLAMKGKKRECTLNEISGEERARYLTEVGNRSKYEGGEAVGITEYEGLHELLISFALKDEKGQPFTLQEIANFPASTSSALFQKCKSMNGLGDNEEAKKQAKNSSKANP